MTHLKTCNFSHGAKRAERITTKKNKKGDGFWNVTERSRLFLEPIQAPSERFQSDFRTISGRLQSDFRAISERFQRNFLERFQRILEAFFENGMDRLRLQREGFRATKE